MFPTSWRSFIALTFLIASVASLPVPRGWETHEITFNNKCGRGTPILSQNFNVLSNGPSYTAHGPFPAVIAYLDTECSVQGSGCAIVEMTLINGGTSSVDISIISPHKLNVPVSFVYTGGCAGLGASCQTADCPTSSAFHVTDDYEAQRQCNTDNSGVAITFC